MEWNINKAKWCTSVWQMGCNWKRRHSN